MRWGEGQGGSDGQEELGEWTKDLTGGEREGKQEKEKWSFSFLKKTAVLPWIREDLHSRHSLGTRCRVINIVSHTHIISHSSLFREA